MDQASDRGRVSTQRELGFNFCRWAGSVIELSLMENRRKKHGGDARRRRQTGDINTPDLHGTVVACACKAKLRRMESESTDGIEMTRE